MAAAASRLRCSSRRTGTTKSITSRGASMAGRRRSIRPCRFIKGWAWALAAVALPAAAEDLAVRTGQAYFDVLAARDTLALVGAQKAAISEQLAQAKRNFEVGTATITDTHEAQARYDLIVAQEIAAQNDLESKRRALQAVTGKEYAQLKPLRAEIRLSPPVPNDMQSWVDLAEKQSYPVLIQQ